MRESQRRPSETEGGAAMILGETKKKMKDKSGGERQGEKL